MLKMLVGQLLVFHEWHLLISIFILSLA